MAYGIYDLLIKTDKESANGTANKIRKKRYYLVKMCKVTIKKQKLLNTVYSKIWDEPQNSLT